MQIRQTSCICDSQILACILLKIMPERLSMYLTGMSPKQLSTNCASWIEFGAMYLVILVTGTVLLIVRDIWASLQPTDFQKLK